MKNCLIKSVGVVTAITVTLAMMSVFGMQALAEDNYYTESDMYTQDFSSVTVPATLGSANNLLGPGSFTNSIFASTGIVWTRTSKTAGSTVSVTDGKLKFTKDSSTGDAGNYYMWSDQIQNVYLKFDKDFDVSSNTTKKLYITYDVEPIDANFTRYANSSKNSANTSLYRALPAFISPINFDSATNTITKIGKHSSQYFLYGHNISNLPYLVYGRTINATDENGYATSYTVDKGGMGYFNANNAWNRNYLNNSKVSGRECYKTDNDAGIAFNELGTVYTVTYEITPAETADGFAKFSRVTITDGDDVVYYEDFTNTTLNYQSLTGNTISGIDFCMSPLMTATIDNLKVYYDRNLTHQLKYEDAVLNSATTYGEAINATLQFDRPVEERDFTVEINNGAAIGAVSLLSGGRSANIPVSGLVPEETYTITVKSTYDGSTLSTASFTAYWQDGYVSQPVITVEGTNATASVEYLAKDSAPSFLLLLAGYDDRGRYIDCQFSELDSSSLSDIKQTFELSGTLSTEGCSTIKAFVWNNLDMIAPLAEYAEIDCSGN